MKLVKLVIFASVIIGLSGCIRPQDREILPVTAIVTIAGDASTGHTFTYAAPFADARGNFDFSGKGAHGKTIALTFTIDGASDPGLRFKADAREAIWIAEKANVDPSTGSPSGPYQGKQFSDFKVSADGRSLTLTDTNDDGVLYRYGLRFDLGTQTVIDDPDINNGGTGGGN